MSLTNSGITSFIASEVIPAGRRVKYIGGHQVALAGIADKEIGVSRLHSGKSSYAINEAVSIALVNNPGSQHVEVTGGVVTSGAIVKRAASGMISAGGTGDNFGIALEAGTTADLLEVLRDPTL